MSYFIDRELKITNIAALQTQIDDLAVFLASIKTQVASIINDEQIPVRDAVLAYVSQLNTTINSLISTISQINSMKNGTIGPQALNKYYYLYKDDIPHTSDNDTFNTQRYRTISTHHLVLTSPTGLIRVSCNFQLTSINVTGQLYFRIKDRVNEYDPLVNSPITTVSEYIADYEKIVIMTTHIQTNRPVDPDMILDLQVRNQVSNGSIIVKNVVWSFIEIEP